MHIGEIIKKQEMAGFQPLKPSTEVEQFKQARNAPAVENRAELQRVLKLIMLKLGIREKNMPTQLEFDVLIQHIQENYSSCTVAEIILAWNAGLAGKLECEMNPYENFSALYFSMVMNAYKKYSVQQLVPMAYEPPKPGIAYTIEDYYSQLRQNVQEYYSRLVTKEYKQVFSGITDSVFTEILLKDGALMDIEVPEGLRVDAHTRKETPAEFFVRMLGLGITKIYEEVK